MLQFLKKIKEKIFLTHIQISSKRKREIYIKLILLVTLIYFRNLIQASLPDYEFSATILNIVIFYIFMDFVMSILRIFIVSRYRKKNKFSSDYTDNFIVGTTKVTRLAIYLSVTISLLFFFGVDVRTFFTTLGLFSVAIAWTFKEKISNVIDGIVIMFSEDIKLKEYIMLGEIKGKVVNVNFLNTKVQTDDGDYAYIPNSTLLNTEFINYSKSNIKRVRVDFRLGPEHSGSISKLQNFLSKSIAKNFKDLVVEDSIQLKIQEISEKYIALTLEMTVTKYNFKIDEKIKSYSSENILKFINKTKNKINKK